MTTATKTVTVERRLNGTPEETFAYFTDPEKHVVWLGTAADLDPTPGGRYVITMTPVSRVVGRYLEIDYPRRLVLEWGIEADPEANMPAVVYNVPPGSTTVEVTFTRDGDATIVRLVQTGLRDDEAVGFTNLGWTGFLDRLMRVIAGEDPGPDPFSGRT